jgi:hypothetical protein
MTTGTTAASAASENWETFSDNSELEPERDARDMYYNKVHQAQGGKRQAAAYSHMAPPPKMRMQAIQRIDESDENRYAGQMPQDMREASDAWSTEQEETY